MTCQCIDTVNSVLGYFASANAYCIYFEYRDDMSDGEPVLCLCCTVNASPEHIARSISVDIWQDRVWCKAVDSDGTVFGASIEDHKRLYHGMPLQGKRAAELMMYLGIDDEWY